MKSQLVIPAILMFLFPVIYFFILGVEGPVEQAKGLLPGGISIVGAIVKGQEPSMLAADTLRPLSQVLRMSSQVRINNPLFSR